MGYFTPITVEEMFKEIDSADISKVEFVEWGKSVDKNSLEELKNLLAEKHASLVQDARGVIFHDEDPKGMEKTLCEMNYFMEMYTITNNIIQCYYS